MTPTAALFLAAAFITPPDPPAAIELQLTPVRVPYARPQDKEPTPALVGRLYVTATSGNDTPADGTLLVLCDMNKVAVDVKPEVLYFGRKFLSERLTTDSRGRSCYDLIFPLPKDWPQEGELCVKAQLKAASGKTFEAPELVLTGPKAN